MVDRLEMERRAMIAALVSTVLASVLWLVAISTDEWCRVTFDEWRLVNVTRPFYAKSYHLGLWHICAHLYFNATDTKDEVGPSKCRRMQLLSFSIISPLSTLL